LRIAKVKQTTTTESTAPSPRGRSSLAPLIEWAKTWVNGKDHPQRQLGDGGDDDPFFQIPAAFETPARCPAAGAACHCPPLPTFAPTAASATMTKVPIVISDA
ncbi:MAG: hypothetical protein MZV70_36085, partial [Desulfobacterales bacterium]|nr:hypothetical protein [Desulfobacterales bacterium]